MLIGTIALLYPNNGNFRDGYWRVTLFFGDESWCQLLYQTHGTTVKGTGSTQNLTGTKSILVYSLRKCRAFRLLRSGSRVRNSCSDSCDVTVKTGADLAKTKKGQVTFAAFHSTKITSV